MVIQSMLLIIKHTIMYDPRQAAFPPPTRQGVHHGTTFNARE